MLALMRSLFRLFLGWKLTPRSKKPFHIFSSKFQKSLTLEHPAFAREFPSLLPLRPRGLPSWLMIRGFPKTGCLRVSAELVGSDLQSPGLTLIQAWRMFIHREVGGLLNFLAVNIQLMSCVVGPNPWTGSLT